MRPRVQPLGPRPVTPEINVKRRTYLLASHPPGVREVSAPVHRVVTVMEIEFINALHKLLTRRVSSGGEHVAL